MSRGQPGKSEHGLSVQQAEKKASGTFSLETTPYLNHVVVAVWSVALPRNGWPRDHRLDRGSCTYCVIKANWSGLNP
jgi:hypothetical protein